MLICYIEDILGVRKMAIQESGENYLETIFVFDIVFLSHIAYTINTQKSQKKRRC